MVPILVVAFHYLISSAIPYGRVVVVAGSVITFCLNGFTRNPHNRRIFLTDYKLASVLSPSLVAGSQIGVLFARWLPLVVLSSLLIAYLIYSLRKTYHKAINIQKANKNNKNDKIQEEEDNLIEKSEEIKISESMSNTRQEVRQNLP